MNPTTVKRKTTDEQIAFLCHNISRKFVALGGLLDKFDLPVTLSDNTPLPKPVKHRKKTRRVAKDPLAPHRNLTSYIHFTNEIRPSIVKNSPNIAPRDVARLLGVKWRALTDKQRSKYDKIAKDDFNRYKSEMEHYINSKTTEKADQSESANGSSAENESDEEEEDELASGNEEEVHVKEVKEVKKPAAKRKATKTKTKAKTIPTPKSKSKSKGKAAVAREEAESDTSSSDSDSSESTETSSSDDE